MNKIYLQIFLKPGIFCTVSWKDQMSKKIQKYKQGKKYFWGYKMDNLKPESALVFRDLEGIAVCCSLRNHRFFIFMLKDESERRTETLDN